VSAPAISVPIVSLTSHLDDRASPLSRFLDHAFPRLDDVAAEALAQMPRTLRAAPDQGFHMPWTTIGTAIDHRLRLAFTPSALPGAGREPAVSCNPITTGIQFAASAAHHAAGAGEPGCQDDANARQAAHQWERVAEVGQALAARLRKMAARTSPHLNPHLALPDLDEAGLCRLCYAAAWFDELAHRPGEEHKILSFIGANDFKNLEEVLTVVPRAAVEDMVTLVRLAARSDLAALRARTSPAAVTTGPLFAGSADVGGADGDLIIAGTLIDIKTTMHPARHLPAGIRQLLGYLLIDYNDEHAITGIGLYLARQGHICTWELGMLLPSLGATTSLGTLRGRCADMLCKAESSELRPEATRLSKARQATGDDRRIR
jgi:hypothetical protein